MSLFTYKGRLADGKDKSGKVTAKTEKDARERLAHEQGVVEVLSWGCPELTDTGREV
jgi:type II secretory pathway component PulF